MVNIDFLNITKNDAGTYKVVRAWNSMDLDDSVHLITIDETTIPRIEMAGHNILNSTIILECRLPSPSNMEIVWKINESLIGSHGRYSQNDRFLSIMNVTVDDQYNSYKCNESGNAVESDPYSIKIFCHSLDEIYPLFTRFNQISSIYLPAVLHNNVSTKLTRGLYKVGKYILETLLISLYVGRCCHVTCQSLATVAAVKYDGILLFPFKRHLLYVLIGAGGVVAVALLAYLSAKIRTCNRVDRESTGNTFTVSNIADRDQNLYEEALPGNYWTILKNTEG
ncbi:hypothetical protein ACJMK2_025734 [Sinanodonta woodiana]|uniref:Ig-like domain-containing protein n=1 Tax=Sinanodonta woodiana TaxID=1069815 RepID=A0ABD3XL69_SINWO